MDNGIVAFARLRLMLLNGHKCNVCGQVLRLGNNGGALCCKVKQRVVNKLVNRGAIGTLAELKMARMKDALDMTNGNKKKAAKLIGVSERTFHRYVAKMTAILALFLLPTVAAAVSLQWDANTESDLAGYKVYRCGLTVSPCNKSTGTLTADTRLQTSFDLAATGWTGAGRERQWFVTAYDNVTPVANESGPSNIVVTSFEPPPPPEPQPFPVTLDASRPEAIVIVNLPKPANPTASEIAMTAVDPDFVDEGELWINGNGPVVLFGDQVGPDASTGITTFAVNPAWWQDGNNELRFLHKRTAGYTIQDAVVTFTVPDVEPPAPPSQLRITIEGGATIIIEGENVRVEPR